MSLFRFFLKRSPRIVVFSLLGSILSGACNAAILAVINNLLKRQGGADSHLIAGFISLCAVLLLSRCLCEILLNSLGQNAMYVLRRELIEQILSAPLRQLEEMGAHQFLAVFTEDIPLITNSILFFPVLCITITVVIGCLVYMASMSLSLFAMVFVFILLGIATYQIPVLRAAQVFRAARIEGEKLIKHFRAVTEGTKELKLHHGRRRAFLEEVVDPTAVLLKNYNLRGMRTYTFAASWGQVLVFVVIGLILLAFPRMHYINSGILTGYVLTVLYLMTPLEVIMNMLPNLARAKAAFDRVTDVGVQLNVKSREMEAQEPGTAFDWRHLVFDSVVHRYRREGDSLDFTLGPVSLVFRRGETVFITGGNGSGKTTFMKLLTGLYLPERGAIFLDSIPTHGMMESYRSNFSVVFSDCFLFEQLLGLSESKTGGTAQHYLHRLKLDTKVTIENGRLSTVDLSQGQRKRLALLTAYLEDRDIYVFDEWAADQDPHFKEVFYVQLLPELKTRGKTVFVISHDDRYYHLADRLIRFEDGQVLSDSQENKSGSGTVEAFREAIHRTKEQTIV